MKYTIKEGFYYTKEHEWLSIEGDTGVVGLSHYASEELGDIAYVELPERGTITRGDKICEIESVKAVSDIYAPISGEITEVNTALTDSPEKINEDPYTAWIVKVRLTDQAEVEQLMSASQYATYLESLE